jgi:hypothetical protein
LLEAGSVRPYNRRRGPAAPEALSCPPIRPFLDVAFSGPRPPP